MLRLSSKYRYINTNAQIHKYKYSLNSKSTTTTYVLSLGEDNSLNTSEVLIFFFSGLFVVVSWISFVVPPEVIPGRMVRKMIPEQMVKKIIPGRMVKIILSCSNANCRQTLQKIKWENFSLNTLNFGKTFKICDGKNEFQHFIHRQRHGNFPQKASLILICPQARPRSNLPWFSFMRFSNFLIS